MLADFSTPAQIFDAYVIPWIRTTSEGDMIVHNIFDDSKMHINMKALPFTILLDTPHNLTYEQIEYLNTMVNTVVKKITKAGLYGIRYLIHLSILWITDSAQWLMIDGKNVFYPEAAEGIMFPAKGESNYARAFGLLNRCIKSICKYYGKNSIFGILFFSSGKPIGDWEQEMSQLLQNNWFIRSERFVIGLGNRIDANCLLRFSGDNKRVLIEKCPEEPIWTCKLNLVVEDMITRIMTKIDDSQFYDRNLSLDGYNNILLKTVRTDEIISRTELIEQFCRYCYNNSMRNTLSMTWKLPDKGEIESPNDEGDKMNSDDSDGSSGWDIYDIDSDDSSGWDIW